jgi:hypothetical protein
VRPDQQVGFRAGQALGAELASYLALVVSPPASM